MDGVILGVLGKVKLRMSSEMEWCSFLLCTFLDIKKHREVP